MPLRPSLHPPLDSDRDGVVLKPYQVDATAPIEAEVVTMDRFGGNEMWVMQVPKLFEALTGCDAKNT